jgi:hypothetical protein
VPFRHSKGQIFDLMKKVSFVRFFILLSFGVNTDGRVHEQWQVHPKNTK